MGSLLRPLRFAFTFDGRPAATGPAEMTVTYHGLISRKTAEADARRRFEEWSRLCNPVARRRSADQVVLA